MEIAIPSKSCKVGMSELPDEVLREIVIIIAKPVDNRANVKFLRSPSYDMLIDKAKLPKPRLDVPEEILSVACLFKRMFAITAEYWYREIKVDNCTKRINHLRAAMLKPAKIGSASTRFNLGHHVERIDVHFTYHANTLSWVKSVVNLIQACPRLVIFNLEADHNLLCSETANIIDALAKFCRKSLKKVSFGIPRPCRQEGNLKSYVKDIPLFPNLSVLVLTESLQYEELLSITNSGSECISLPTLHSLSCIGLHFQYLKVLSLLEAPRIKYVKIYRPHYFNDLNPAEYLQGVMQIIQKHGPRLRILELYGLQVPLQIMDRIFDSCLHLKELHIDLSSIVHGEVVLSHSYIARLYLSSEGFGCLHPLKKMNVFMQSLSDRTKFPQLTVLMTTRQWGGPCNWGVLWNESEVGVDGLQKWIQIIKNRNLHLHDSLNVFSPYGAPSHTSENREILRSHYYDHDTNVLFYQPGRSK